MSWGVLRPWFVVCSEQKIYGRPATNGTGHQEETGIIDNDHPSINNEGNGMDVPGRTSCSLWFFFDVMGSIAPPGLWSAQIYESSTAGNGWDGTPGETGHHRQWSSIISIMRAPGRTSCSPRFFFDVMGNIAPPGLWAAQTYGSSTAGNKWDGTPGKPGIIDNDHPSYQWRGHQDGRTRRMSCSQWFFYQWFNNFLLFRYPGVSFFLGGTLYSKIHVPFSQLRH